MDNKNSIIKQLSSRINGLKKICYNSSFKTRLMVANGVFMSKLVYLIVVWGGAQKYLLNSLQVQQLAAARLVCGFHSKWWSKYRLLKKVGWLSVNQLVFYNTVLQAHKTITTGKPECINDLIRTEHPYSTRSATANQIRFGESFRHGSNIASSSFKQRAVKSYNSVPLSIRSGSLVTVKRKLRKWVWQNVPIC